MFFKYLLFDWYLPFFKNKDIQWQPTNIVNYVTILHCDWPKTDVKWSS